MNQDRANDSSACRNQRWPKEIETRLKTGLEGFIKELKQHVEDSQKGLRVDLQVEVKSLLEQLLQNIQTGWETKLQSFQAGITRQIKEGG